MAENTEVSPSQPAPGKGGGLFLRRSSGLVRAFSIFDGFLYGVYADSIVVAAALTYSLCWPWKDANIPLGIMLCCLAFLPCFTVYAMLTSLMPRAGGDYIWQSRAFGGFWGYILTFVPLLFAPWFYMASNVAPGSTMVVAPLFISLGNILHIPGLITFAVSLTTTTGTFFFYAFYCTIGAVILALGMKIYARVQRWSFYIGMVAIATWFVMLLLTSSTAFQQAFNSFMLNTMHWGAGAAYQQILNMAKTNGFVGVSLSQTHLGSSFLIGPVLAYTFMYIAWTGTLVGEIGGVNQFKNSFKMFWGGNLFSMVICALFLWLLISRVGNQFFTSANFLWASGHSGDMPVAPYYGIFLMSLTKSPWIWLWIAIGLNAWFWIWPTNNMVMSTRVMFAMSYDRMLPGFVARVSRRWGAPITAILICYVGCLIMGWLYFFTGFAKLTLDMPLITSIAFAASTLVGTLFPYLKSTKQIYADSPISKYKLFGIPLISIAGVLGLIYFGFMFYLYITDGRYGTNDPLSIKYIIGSIAVSALIYFGYRIFRKRQGINTDLTYKEIPSE
jgi:amino acid transporter